MTLRGMNSELWFGVLKTLVSFRSGEFRLGINMCASESTVNRVTGRF